MSWLKNLNPFKKDEAGQGAPQTTPQPGSIVPELPKELEGMPGAKGMMAMFYRKWKDPAFLAQLKALAGHMQKDGVDVKDQNAVKAWIEKNKDAIAKGKFSAPPEDEGAKVETFVKTGPDIGRNDPCTCGSGKKYKKCCASKA